MRLAVLLGIQEQCLNLRRVLQPPRGPLRPPTLRYLAGVEERVRLAAEAAGSPGLRYTGILFYPGHIRMPVPAIEACAWTDCAYSVLATVVSTSIPGQAVVDAGSKALGKETVNGSLPDPSVAAGFGCVLDEPELRVTTLSEEHGIIDLSGSPWKARPGDLVRIVPNNVCVSVNLMARLWQVRGDEVLGFWPVEARRE